MSPVALGVIGILVVCIGLGQPLYVLLGGLASFLLLYSTDTITSFGDLIILIEETRGLSEQEVLLAIPFFVISGAIMSEGNISRKLVGFAQTLLRGVPGGLAVAAVIGCIFFAAISGSSPVTVIAIGTIVYPAMINEGYSDRFSAGLVSSAGSLGILIPPSIPMIVYALVDPKGLADPPNYMIARAGESIDLRDLFFAGIGPGMLIGSIFIFYSVYEGARIGHRNEKGTAVAKAAGTFANGIARLGWRLFCVAPFVMLAGLPTILINRLAPEAAKSLPGTFKPGGIVYDVAEAFGDGFWALMLPVIILGGIYSGLFTPTEAACVSVVYALFVEVAIYRSLHLHKLPGVFGEATVLIGSLLIIIAVAQGFNEFLEEAEVPQMLVDTILDMQLSTVAFLLVVNILLLIVGCFMDIMSAILILVPLLSPVAFQLGIHPVHLAIVFIVNLEIGYLTPPLGLNLFVASSIFEKPIGEVIRSVIPFTGLMLIGLLFITYVPTIALGPVSVKNGHELYVPFPERKIPMDSLAPEDSLRFLSRLAELADEAEADGGDEGEDEGVLTLAELLAQANADIEDQGMQALGEQPLDEVLRDYLRLHNDEVSLRVLMDDYISDD